MASSGMLRRVALVRTYVSEELRASIIRVTRIDELRTPLAVTSNRRTLQRVAAFRGFNHYFGRDLPVFRMKLLSPFCTYLSAISSCGECSPESGQLQYHFTLFCSTTHTHTHLPIQSFTPVHFQTRGQLQRKRDFKTRHTAIHTF
jgi:hypothetical protein